MSNLLLWDGKGIASGSTDCGAGSARPVARTGRADKSHSARDPARARAECYVRNEPDPLNPRVWL